MHVVCFGLAVIGLVSGACRDDIKITRKEAQPAPITDGQSNPFSGIGLDRAHYQSSSPVVVVLDTNLDGANSVTVQIDGTDFEADVVSAAAYPFAPIESIKQLLLPRDQNGLGELLGYGKKDITLSLSYGDIDRLATLSVDRSDFDYMANSLEAPIVSQSGEIQAWFNLQMGGDGSGASPYGTVSYTPNEALVTGFQSIVHY